MLDLIIIGFGVSGMTASIYASRANLNFLVLEQNSPGGVLNKIQKIENYPGFEEINGPELAYKIFMQTQKYKVDLKIEKVVKIIKYDDYFLVKTNKSEFKSKSIILSTGRGQTKKVFSNEEEFIGRGLSYCAVCDANLYKDKDVAVVGDNALEEAIYLSDIVNKVYLITEKKEEINKQNIEVVESKAKVIVSDDESIIGVKLESDQIINVSGIFISNTQTTMNNIFEDKSIFNESGYVIVDENMRTKIKGLYACGDAINKKVYQIVTACSDGAKAVLSAKEDLKQ